MWAESSFPIWVLSWSANRAAGTVFPPVTAGVRRPSSASSPARTTGLAADLDELALLDRIPLGQGAFLQHPQRAPVAARLRLAALLLGQLGDRGRGSLQLLRALLALLLALGHGGTVARGIGLPYLIVTIRCVATAARTNRSPSSTSPRVDRDQHDRPVVVAPPSARALGQRGARPPRDRAPGRSAAVPTSSRPSRSGLPATGRPARRSVEDSRCRRPRPPPPADLLRRGSLRRRRAAAGRRPSYCSRAALRGRARPPSVAARLPVESFRCRDARAAVDECSVDGEVVVPRTVGSTAAGVTSRVVGPFKGGPGSWAHR